MRSRPRPRLQSHPQSRLTGPVPGIWACLGLALCLCLWARTLPAQDLEKVTLVTHQLAENLYVVSGAGGNIAVLVGNDGTLLVDSGYPGLEDKVKTAVAEIGPQPVRYAVNTHWHFDHVGGNQRLTAAGAILVAHANIRRRMSAAQHIAVLDKDVPASPPDALPVITFGDSLSLWLGDQEVVVRHLPPAHTDGDSIVVFGDANVIHPGDVFFNCGYPFIDVEAGGDIDGMIAAAETVLELCDDETRIIPGHGPVATRTDLETYLGMLHAFREVIAGELAAGKDLPAILEARPTAELDERWGGVFFPPEQFTEMVFLSLSS